MADEWSDLFDGESLDGWSATGNPDAWLVDDGCIHCTGDGGGYLYSYPTFEDFDLTLEFRIDDGVNSGVFFRWSNLAQPVQTGMEIQILDTHGTEELDSHDCGALYDMVPPASDAVKPAGEWNRLELSCRGHRVQETLNGEEVLDVDLSNWDVPGENPDGSSNKFDHAWADMPRRGHLGLQDHDGAVWFRDIRVRDETSPFLADR
jgi:hypothetical protein